ncbi:unnamed protein product [Sphacelaria rigidula]
MARNVRQTVDPSVAKQACEAVRSKQMTVLGAQKAFGISRKSILRRLKGDCAMDAKVGAATVLSQEDENSIVDTLLYAAHHHLGLTRSDLVEAVRQLCNDGRNISWKADEGPGPKRVRGFFERHQQLSERSSRTYEANRVVANDDERLRSFNKSWEDFTKEHDIEADHL